MLAWAQRWGVLPAGMSCPQGWGTLCPPSWEVWSYPEQTSCLLLTAYWLWMLESYFNLFCALRKSKVREVLTQPSRLVCSATLPCALPSSCFKVNLSPLAQSGCTFSSEAGKTVEEMLPLLSHILSSWHLHTVNTTWILQHCSWPCFLHVFSFLPLSPFSSSC